MKILNCWPLWLSYRKLETYNIWASDLTASLCASFYSRMRRERKNVRKTVWIYWSDINFNTVEKRTNTGQAREQHRPGAWPVLLPSGRCWSIAMAMDAHRPDRFSTVVSLPCPQVRWQVPARPVHASRPDRHAVNVTNAVTNVVTHQDRL